jgi:hypothetical protein
MFFTSTVPLLSQGLQKPVAEQRSLSWAEDFLYAGVSSFLLVVVRLLTQFSPLYLLALLPYVWRTLHADRPRSIRLGSFLATSFAFVAYADNLVNNPWAFTFQLFFLNLIFISYGVAVHQARKVFGASPLFVVYLWLPIEYCLNNLAGEGKLFAISVVEPSLILRLNVLLNLLVIPLAIILLNPLLLLVAGYIVKRVLGGTRLLIERTKRQTPHISPVASVRQWFYFPDLPSPPLLT